ncbi:MAG: autotransporter-associated beta strand repeat-containing protein, partial [Luteolibacter sp.]
DLGSTPVTLSANPTVTVAANTLTVGGVITNTGTLTKAGPGTLALTGSTTDGSFSVTAGTLKFSGGSFAAKNNATDWNVYATGGTVLISDTASVTLPGVLSLGRATSATGNLNQTGGTLTVNGLSGGSPSDRGLVIAEYASSTGTYTLSGGSLSVTNAIWVGQNGTATWTISGGTASVNKLGFASTAGSGTLNLDGGTLTVGFGGITKGSGAGIINFNGGKLQAGPSTGISLTGLTTANVRTGGAIIDINGNTLTIGQVLLHDSALGATADGGLTVDDAAGGGILTLTSASTYTGPTTILAGTLSLGTGGSISSSSLIDVRAGSYFEAFYGATITSGQTLQGTGTATGTLTIAAGGTISPGGPVIGILSMTDTLTVSGTANFQIDKTGTVLTNDKVAGLSQVIYGGTLNVTATGAALSVGNSFKLFDASSYSGNFSVFNLPVLPAGLFWETSTLLTTGTITVANAVSTPTFNPPSGGYVGAQSVTITSAPGSTIRYTTDGTNPVTSGTVQFGPSPLAGVVVPTNSTGFTIKAYATKSGSTSSAAVSAVYNTITTPTWTRNGDGLWSDPSNWLYSVVPSGVGVSADFSTLTKGDISYVTLDSPVTVGNLKFGDLGNQYGWTLDGTNALTLDAGVSTPVVTVNNQTTTISTPLAGTHGFSKTGNGTLVLTGVNTYSGGTAVNQGTLQLGDGVNNGSLNGPYNIAAGATLRLARNAKTTVPNSSLTGSGTVSLFVTGTSNGTANYQWDAFTTFDANFTGKLVVEEGRVSYAVANLGGTSAIEIQDGAQFLASSGTYNVPISIAGNGWGENGYPGGLRLAGSSTATWNGSVTLTADSSINMQRAGAFTITGPISGNYLCDFHAGDPNGASGTLTIAPASAVQNSYGSSKITGVGGTSMIVAGNQYAFSTGGLEMTSGGTLQLNGFNFAFANLSGTGGSLGNYNASNLSVVTVGSDNSNTAYSGLLANGGAAALALTKTGAGNLTLTAAQSFTGATTVSSGTLTVDGSLAAGSAVTVSSGATLAGVGTVNGTTSVASGGMVSPGGTATLTTGATTLAGTFVCQLDDTTSDKLAVNGNLTLTGSTLAVSTLVGGATQSSYVIATYTGTRNGNFATVTGLPAGYVVDYSTANQIKLVVGSGSSGYSTWASNYSLSGNDALPGADPDRDGVTNLMEFYLNGNPTVGNQTILPVATLDATYLKLTFKRLDAAESEATSQAAQYGSTLTGWTSAAIGAASSGPDANGVIVAVTENGALPDDVVVSVPRSQAVGGRFFGRITVVK